MLAIVIPYYKIDYFEECLRSLSQQSNKNFTVYIGDDNGPSNPEPILHRYSSSFRIRYIHYNENFGRKSLVKHWSRCLEQLENEEWIMILGDDDNLGPNCVEEFYNSIEKMNDADINVFRFASVVVNHFGKEITDTYEHPTVESSVHSLFRKLGGNTRSSLSEYIFRRKNLDVIGIRHFPLAWYADDMAVLEVSGYDKIFSSNKAIVQFRNSGINISSKSDNVVQKNRASFLFFYYLLEEKAFPMEIDQKKILYSKLEKTYFNDKMNLGMFMKFHRINIQNKRVIYLLKFWKDFFLSNWKKTIWE